MSDETLSKAELPLCECGCGKRVLRKENRFINGHNKGNLGSGKSKPEPQLCECGCGKLAKPGNRFIFGHGNKGRVFSTGWRSNISDGGIKRFSNQSECDAQSERLTRYHLNHPEAGESHSEFMIQRFIDNPELGKEHSEKMRQYFTDNTDILDVISERMIQYHIDHPEAGKEHSKRMIQYYIDHPEESRAQSERIKQFHADNPNFYDEYNEDMCGGHDIVNHHMIYDHSDLSKNIMPMTRSIHMKLHQLFRKHGIIIPHINREC